MTRDDEPNAIDRELDSLHEKAGALIEPCRFRSSFSAYGELRRQARNHHRLAHYVESVFFQMDQAQYLLDFQTMRERAVELISLLESEERARRIQSDFAEETYELVIGTMSACAYENLAEATGQLQGFNSEGMHACIADGIQVCRRTGKLACISCFREYSVDVYTAADDLEIARYQCQQLLDHPGPWSDRGDRRWLAAVKASWLELLHGNLPGARELAHRARQLAREPEVAVATEAAIRSLLASLTIAAASGEPTELLREELARLLPPPGEAPEFERQLTLVDALEDADAGRWEQALARLEAQDADLSRRGARRHWFEARLRLIALRRLTGAVEQVRRLAAPLEKAAQQANDWLTLRRLHRLTDEDFPPTALAVLDRWREDGAVPPAAAPPAGRSAASSETPPEHPEEGREPTPLGEELDALGDQIQEAYQDEDAESKVDAALLRLLQYGPEQASHPSDAGRLIHYASHLPLLGRAAAIWQWANRLAAPHRDDARTLSVLGALGASIRAQQVPEADGEELATVERLDQIFRKSLQLDSGNANNFCRAGDFYMQEGNHGEAERCYSRAFRLDRRSPSIAARLAELYKHTDRPRDALQVLDMCLRDGCREPQITCDAGVLAFTLGNYESALTYFERFESQVTDEPSLWVQYYRAVALYELGRHEEAFQAIREERERAGEDAFHLAGIRSCIERELGDLAAADEDLRIFLETPLQSVDYLSPKGVEETILRVWDSVKDLPGQQAAARELEQRLLETGFMPDEYFDALRQQNSPESNLAFFRCLVRQPLDEQWPRSRGCLAGQEDWVHYFAEWGVLARDEDHAADLALNAQLACYEGAAPQVVAVEPGEGNFEDRPGVVWQGMRFGGNDDDDDTGEEEDLYGDLGDDVL